jgi:hypothetical protein
MTGKLTQGAAIQAHLEELTRQAESRNAELKQRLDELNEQLANGPPGSSRFAPVKIGENATLRIGTGRFDKVIRSTASYDDFLSTVLSSTRSDSRYIGHRDDQGRIVWIRTTQDLHFTFAWYFAMELPFLQVVPIDPEAVAPIERFAFAKEIKFKDGMPVFRCECAGPEAPLIYLTLPTGNSQAEAMLYLEGVFGPIASLMFVDEADDRITIDSPESWDYCVETAGITSVSGRFSLLLVEIAAE